MRLFYWLRVHAKFALRHVCYIDSFCKECGRSVHDFVVDDATWAKVEPLIKRGHVLCYDCFCDKCEQVGIFHVWRLERLQ